MDNNQIAHGLQALSGDLGMFAGYAADKEKMAAQQASDERRDASNKAFQAALENARMQNENDHFNRTDTRQQEQFAASKEFQQKELDSRTDYQNRVLEQTDKYHGQQLGIDQQRLGIERTKAENDKADRADTKKAQIIGSQLTGVGRRLDNQRKLMTTELQKALADPMVMGDDAAQQRIKSSIEAKYKPILDPLQRDYEANKKRYADLTGVEFDDSSITDDPIDSGLSDTSTGNGYPNSGAPALPSQDPALVAAGMVPGTPAAGAPKSPYPEGTRLTGPDGKPYIVKNGIPVPQ